MEKVAKDAEKGIIRAIAERIATAKMKSKTGKAPHGFISRLLKAHESFSFITRDKVEYAVIKVEKEWAENASKLSHIATSAPVLLVDDSPESRGQDKECLIIDSDHSSDPSCPSPSAESANLQIHPDLQQTVLLDKHNWLSSNEEGSGESNSSNTAMDTTDRSSNWYETS